jgi:hypothetical protein
MLAFIAAGVCSASQAAELYSQDGVEIGLSGELELRYIKTKSEQQNLELDVSEANLALDVLYDMTEDFSIGAHIDYDSNNDDDSVTRGDIYMSLIIQQAHTLSFGVQPTILDDAGIGEDYAFGFTSFVNDIALSGDQVAKYKYDGGEMFYGGLAYSSYQNTTDVTRSDDDYVLDGNIGARIEDYELTLFAVNAERNKLKRSSYVGELRYFIADLSLATTYATTSEEQVVGSDLDIDLFGLAATYWDGGRLEYSAGWANVDNSSNNEKINDYYANVTYIFTNYVKAFAEVGASDEDNTDFGYTIGINGTF